MTVFSAFHFGCCAYFPPILLACRVLLFFFFASTLAMAPVNLWKCINNQVLEIKCEKIRSRTTTTTKRREKERKKERELQKARVLWSFLFSFSTFTICKYASFFLFARVLYLEMDKFFFWSSTAKNNAKQNQNIFGAKERFTEIKPHSREINYKHRLI